MRRPFSLWQRLGRLVHLRLMIPVRRSAHPPEYTARGITVGLFWAFTPLIGVQMYLVGLTWLVARARPGWEFNILVALAWTWVTNVFTLIPVYYVYYITGQLMLGQPSLASGYAHFAAAWEAALSVEGLWQGIVAWAQVIWTEQGLPMFIGCVPYAIGSAWLGYRLSVAYIVRLRRMKRMRALRKLQRRAAAEERAAHEAAAASVGEPATAAAGKPATAPAGKAKGDPEQ
ncbi:MAG: DUF2062 domain-containing protein [Rhodospirillales bacterium]|nr:DUF2062 domain-containing protein [Rhodospirillales bacterium]